MTTKRRLVKAMGLLALGVGVWGGFPGCTDRVAEEELASRVRTSAPEWQSYQEDLKAQVGAGPVAQWKGRPTQVWSGGAAVYVAFEVSGPWAQRDAAIPVLLRDPFGGVHRNVSAQRNGAVVTYAFQVLAEPSAVPLAWVEIKFPRGERRVILSTEGRGEIGR